MTVHINGSKGKDLYYGGVKIKEAYYGSTKVYSSGPLYYCYRMKDTDGNYMYRYYKKYPTVGNNIASGYYQGNNVWAPYTQATSSSQLEDYTAEDKITEVTDTQIKIEAYLAEYDWTFYVQYTRYPSGDLYT